MGGVKSRVLPCGDAVRDGASVKGVCLTGCLPLSFHLRLFLGLSSNIETTPSAVFVPFWFTIEPTSSATLSSPLPVLCFLTPPSSVCRHGRHGSV